MSNPIIFNPAVSQRWLKLDGTGTQNATGNYSGVGNEEYFYLESPANSAYEIHLIVISVLAPTIVDIEDYGGIAALSTGYKFSKFDGSNNVIHNITELIVNNDDLAALSQQTDGVLSGLGGGTNDIEVFRLSLDEIGGPLVIQNGDRFGVLLNDDFSGLAGHKFTVWFRELENLI